MIKFRSSSKTLEILKYSKRRQVFLNRPFVLLLEQLGCRKETLLNYQRRTLEYVTKSFLSPDAAAMLMRNFSSLFSSIIPINKLVNAQVNILDEEFFRRALDVVVSG